jgi:hypothetical protein
MLISMPTGTSTIFGAFQAILALLLDRANSTLPDKLMLFKKFASEIFAREPLIVMLQCTRIHVVVRCGVKPTAE